MVVLRGPDHVFEVVNAAYYELVGQREVIGKPAREALPEMRGQGYFAMLDQAYSTGRSQRAAAASWLLERVPGKGLEERFVSFVFQPFGDATNAVAGICALGFDITELKQAQRALRAAQQHKDDFVAVLAHELRNPLAPIQQAARIASMSGATAAQLHWSGEVIDRQVGHMALLLDDLLDLSRVTRGKLHLRTAPVDLAAVVASAIETARPLIDARHHALIVHLQKDMPALHADALRLAQVIANLLTNAAKYTEPGGRIELAASREKDEVAISVSDTGIGIPQESIASVFEMFSQLRAPLERSETGLGIGLALVKALVELHGGTVAAHSSGIGEGSTFIVRLPMSGAGADQPDSARARGEADRGGALKILIVDDNRDAAESLAMLLSFDGHELRCAADGAEGILLAEQFRPAVILLDIGLPQLNGYEVAQKLRASSWAKTLPLIAITGWGLAEDKRRALAAGFDRHLTKPVDIDELRRVLGSLQDASLAQSTTSQSTRDLSAEHSAER
jgi:signal transduction histidine kinase/FixJ family two-component response regulator